MKLLYIAQYTSILSVTLALVSGVFLIDSLRRLRKAFQENHSFSENKSKMAAHVMSLVVSQIMLMLCILLQDNNNVEIDTLRIVFSLTLIVSQSVFIYLLVQFSKPPVKPSTHTSLGLELESEMVDSLYNSNKV